MTTEGVRDLIMFRLRAISSMAASVGDIEGKLSIPIHCKLKEFDEAIESIDSTFWFIRNGFKFFVSDRINVTFYID